MTEIMSVLLKAAECLLIMSDSVGRLLSYSWAGGGTPKHFRKTGNLTIPTHFSHGVSLDSYFHHHDKHLHPHLLAKMSEEILFISIDPKYQNVRSTNRVFLKRPLHPLKSLPIREMERR